MAGPTPINAVHAKCCALVENSHQCQNSKGNPWRVGWQKPGDLEDDELSQKGPATAYMLGKFEEFPGYFNDPSLSEEQKRQRIEDAKARILRVLRREAERLGLESPDHWSPEVARPILRARIQHTRERCRVSHRGSSTRPAEEKDEFSAVVAALERLGLEWKPSAVGSDSV
ncbi:hypothetical protein F5X96DRAFT_220404 [Biscogniauxia mediterranea]|nr:hypothetical protein F5X96DRAFT_220404 [Biscogniauxia mediterranea]